MKLIQILMISLAFQLSIQSQSTNNANSIKVSLDGAIAINQNHPYFSFFGVQDEGYISWLYKVNKKNMRNAPELSNPAILVLNQEGNNSLIFTIEEEGKIKFDTLRNSVHDMRNQSRLKKWYRSLVSSVTNMNNGFQQDLRGNLPKGAMMWLEDKNWGLKFGVLVPGLTSDVKVDIRDQHGNHIVTIVDHQLKKGWNNFKWRRSTNPNGVYNISVSMDGQTMTQNFEI